MIRGEAIIQGVSSVVFAIGEGEVPQWLARIREHGL